MKQSWVLHVENIGRIGSADVRIAPLLLFVGDNNSGKSYLMSILWGLLSQGKDLFSTKSAFAGKYLICEKWLQDHLGQRIVIDDTVAKIYIDWFNELLKINKKEFLLRIFNHAVSSSAIEIRDFQIQKDLMVLFEDNLRYKFSESNGYIKIPAKEEYQNEDLRRMNVYICWNLLMGGIAAPIFAPVSRGRRIGEPVYLPTSRTGFMLTYSQLLERSIEMNFSGMEAIDAGKLTLPYVDFLQLITKFEQKNKLRKDYQNLVDFLEQKMVDGDFRIKKAMLPKFTYKPQSSEKDMPLHITSSVVTELAPLLMLLQSNIDFKTIIIEEPEAHLHPSLQKMMSRFIIRLMNSGKTVWITTHSDIILQQLNNMIKLKNNKNCIELMKEFLYDDMDLLEYKKVGVYQFSRNKTSGKTDVDELMSGKYGFEVPTFNDALEELLNEVYHLQEEDSDD